MPAVACIPCRERKLKCDRRPLSCSNCTRAGLTCPGFAKDLSWPKASNGKRHLVGPEPCKDLTAQKPRRGTSRWVNVRVGDIETYQRIAAVQSLQEPQAHFKGSLLSFKKGPSWTPTSLNTSELTLLQYFQMEAALAITCGNSTDHLLGVVTRLAFYDDSASSLAVLHAVLAVASLRRNGPTSSTIARHGAALRALKTSAEAGISGTKVTQHVAAGVLLCCFEIHHKGGSSRPWYSNVINTKGLLKGLNLDRHAAVYEFLAMTNWLYHHDVHAQFSCRHWRRAGSRGPILDDRQQMRPILHTNTNSMTNIVQDLTKLTHVSTPSHRVLWPMADIFQNLVDSSHPHYHSERYRQELDDIERDLESILNGKYVAETHRRAPTANLSIEDMDFFDLEAYRLAALIYLERVSGNLSGTSSKIDRWANSAFNLLENLGSLKHSFPIFIIGCEARTDEQRLVILDCIQRTQSFLPSATMDMVHDMLQSAWAMEDLETERELDYVAKLDTLISGCETMPSFA